MLTSLDSQIYALILINRQLIDLKIFTILNNLMRTLVDVVRFLWAKVKDFATVRDLTLSCALNRLLVIALSSQGYGIKKEETK